jgi:hypothetical protein
MLVAEGKHGPPGSVRRRCWAHVAAADTAFVRGARRAQRAAPSAECAHCFAYKETVSHAGGGRWMGYAPASGSFGRRLRLIAHGGALELVWFQWHDRTWAVCVGPLL